MNENKKNNYTAPAVNVVAFQVEQGFAGTLTSIGSFRTNTSTNPPTVEVQDQGTESFIPRDLQ